MKQIIKTVFWILVIILCSFSFAVVAQVFNPQEKINALWLTVCAICFLALGYRFYGVFIAKKIANLDDTRTTPSERLNNGHDYVPTNKYIVFGHHFAAIAGAGPLMGPVLAAQFGYLPGFLWILVGAVFAGAVHDFIILVMSIRRDGKSISQFATEEIGPVCGIASGIAIFIIMIVAIAGLGLAVVNALKDSAWGLFTIAATIPIALFIGIYLRYIRKDKTLEASVIGFVLLILAVVSGQWVQEHESIARFFIYDGKTLTILLAIYGFFAASLPVWLLLAPRDYLSSFLKIGVIFLLAVGVIFVAPTLEMPPVTRFIHGGGPVLPGALFPFLFITIACGAISGFHSVIGSGTTPKMIKKESECLFIGYGGMLMEAFVAVMALIAACILMPQDYFAINASKLPIWAEPIELDALTQMVGEESLVGRTGGAVSLAVGMTKVFSSLPFMGSIAAIWYHFAIMFEALFILTTIDAGTRVSRFLFQESLGMINSSWADYRNKFTNVIGSFVIVFAWGYLIYNGDVATIWPIFGVANQLLSAIALAIGSTILIKMKKAKYLLISAIPMFFMFIVTVTCAYEQVFNPEFGQLLKALDPNSSNQIVVSSTVNIILLLTISGLALIVLFDSLCKWYLFLVKKIPFNLHETSPRSQLSINIGDSSAYLS
ncbi:MAG: carbon starvation protein A [Candidatus Melainabacteria bacterium]|nr:carbon starvation protein A [Candidatus Melainabacteria bacterium]